MPCAVQLFISVSTIGICIVFSLGVGTFSSFGLSTVNTPSFLHPALYTVNPLQPHSQAATYNWNIVSSLVSSTKFTVELILASIYSCHLPYTATLSNGLIFCAVAIVFSCNLSITLLSNIYCIIGVYTS